MSRVHHEEIVSPGVVHIMDSSSHQNCQHLQVGEHLLRGEGGEGGRRRGGRSGDEYKCSKRLTLVWSLSTSSAFASSKKLVAIRTSAACSLL